MCVVRLMLIARILMFLTVMISCCSIPCTFMVSPGHRIRIVCQHSHCVFFMTEGEEAEESGHH
jgi:hypothetical protein